MNAKFILSIILIISISPSTESTEYVTHSSDYFSVDCPNNWTLDEFDVDSINYIVDCELIRILSSLYGLRFPYAHADYLYIYYDECNESNSFGVASLQIDDIKFLGIAFGDAMFTSEGVLNSRGQKIIESLKFNITEGELPAPIMQDNEISEYVRWSSPYFIIDSPEGWNSSLLDASFMTDVIYMMYPTIQSEFDTTPSSFKLDFSCFFFDENCKENSFAIASLQENGVRFRGIVFSSVMFRPEGTFDLRAQHIVDSTRFK